MDFGARGIYLVSELFRDFEPLVVVVDGEREVSQQVVDVAQVSAGSALGSLVANLFHQDHVLEI